MGEINDNVKTTLVFALTTEDKDTYTEAASPAKIVSGDPATVAETGGFVNVTSTDDAAMAVPAAITTTTVLALAYVQDAAGVPALGVAPTLALQAKPEMKLVPVTVMVLPT